MAWVKLDDNFYSHPKVVSAGVEAIGLYVLALTYSSRHLTDGHIPAAWVKQIVGPKARKLSGALVEHGLWAENGTGWLIHDFLIYNPSRDKVLSKRAADSARKAGAT
jgi:hypothetical protein